MNYNEFVCECLMRLGTVTSTDTANYSFPPQACLTRALALAATLVKAGFISPNFELLRIRFEAYRDALEKAYKGRIEEQLTLGLSRDVVAIQRFIDAKNLFYAIANPIMPELIEQARKGVAKKRGKDVSISAAAETFFVSIERFEQDLLTQEKELIDKLEPHRNNPDVFQLYAALIADKAEGRSIEQLGQVWKNACGALANKSPKPATLKADLQIPKAKRKKRISTQ